MPKYGEPPMNHGVRFPAGPGAGELPASQIRCTCQLVEITARVPAYVADHVQRHAVDKLAAVALKQFGAAPTDPCIAIP